MYGSDLISGYHKYYFLAAVVHIIKASLISRTVISLLMWDCWKEEWKRKYYTGKKLWNEISKNYRMGTERLIVSSLTIFLKMLIVQFIIGNTVILITQGNGKEKEAFQSHTLFFFFHFAEVISPIRSFILLLISKSSWTWMGFDLEGVALGKKCWRFFQFTYYLTVRKME